LEFVTVFEKRIISVTYSLSEHTYASGLVVEGKKRSLLFVCFTKSSLLYHESERRAASPRQRGSS